jgi:hypothetical protein
MSERDQGLIGDVHITDVAWQVRKPTTTFNFYRKSDFNSRSLDIGNNLLYFKHPGKLHRKSTLITHDLKPWKIVFVEEINIRLHN